MVKKLFAFVCHAVIILCIAALTACKPTLDTVSKTENFDELRTIAQTKDIQTNVKNAAIEKLGKIGAITQLEQMVDYPGKEDPALRSKVLNVLGSTTNYVETTSNQKILALIATTNKNHLIRLKALNRITDSLTLLTLAEHPLWKPRSPHIAAIFNTKDMQSKLYGIVVYSNFHHKNKGHMRKLAVKHLTDITVVEMLLSSARVQVNNPSLKEAVWNKFDNMMRLVTDEDIITRFVVRDYYPGTTANILQERLEAGVVKSKALLFKIATRSSNPKFVKAAVGNITDQTVLTKIAIEGKNGVAAVDLVTKPSLLAQIAKDASRKEVVLAALKRISDPAVLAQIAKSDQSSNVTLTALEKIHDQETLVDIAKSDASFKVALTATEKITDPQHLFQIASSTKRVRLANHILRHLKDPKLQLDIARNTQIDLTALYFVKNATELEVLSDFLATAHSLEARFAAVEKFLKLKHGKEQGVRRRHMLVMDERSCCFSLSSWIKGLKITMEISQ